MLRLLRKVKKLFKNIFYNELENFLKEKKECLKREEHLNKVFTRNYKDSKRIFHKVLKNEK